MVEKKTLPVGGPLASYQTMSSDGSRVFFLEHGELYELNTSTGVQSDLTANHGAGEVSAGVQPAVWNVTEDGSYVYFVAKGVLAKNGIGPPPLTGQSTVGGTVSVIHACVLEEDPRPLIELLNPLMSMIVHPYLGTAAARRELDHHVPPPNPARNGHAHKHARDPFKDLPIRITFRTARVLATIGAQPGASNRQIGDMAGVADQGQMSKLLNRLEGFQLIENHGQGHAKGEPNAWQLTPRGHGILQAISEDGASSAGPAGDR
jgi:DNA-binding MarR family transcriptional regulator